MKKSLFLRYHLKREKKFRQIIEENPAVVPTQSPATMENDLIKAQEIMILRKALNQLPIRDRIILSLYKEGFTSTDLAKLINVKKNSIGKILARSIEKLANPKGFSKGCFVVKLAGVISTKDLQRVWRARLDNGALGVGFRLKPDAAGRLAKYTTANKGKKLAIILGNRVMTAPTIHDVISEEGIISGRFTEEELDQIIIQLKLAISKSK